MTIPIQRIEEARRLLRDHFPPTRLVRAAGAHCAAGHLFLKLETGLPTGSFKVRGALYALSLRTQSGRIAEVIAASTGNHGAAVAWAGRLLHVPTTIFLPERPNPVKAERIRALGARIIEAGVDLSAAIDAAYEYAAQSGAFFLHDAADPDVPIGAGTIGLEILDQLPPADTIYVPMGDTALVRGVAAAAKQRKPTIRIVGAAAAGAPAYYLSFQQGTAVETPPARTIADGLAVRRALPQNVDAVRALVDEVRLVNDEELLGAMAVLDRNEHIVAEPAGAAAMAAYRQASPRSGIAVALVTGCNIAPELRQQVAAI